MRTIIFIAPLQSGTTCLKYLDTQSTIAQGLQLPGQPFCSYRSWSVHAEARCHCKNVIASDFHAKNELCAAQNACLNSLEIKSASITAAVRRFAPAVRHVATGADTNISHSCFISCELHSCSGRPFSCTQGAKTEDVAGMRTHRSERTFNRFSRCGHSG